MSDLVDPSEIEQIVGCRRLPYGHVARAVSAEETVYILHSHACKASEIDLRNCEMSLALDNGIDVARWERWMDRPVLVAIEGDQLVPGTEIYFASGYTEGTK